MERGRLIKSLAVREGVTLVELARRLGISKQALHMRLRGKMMLNTFEECMQALGYDLYYGKDGEVYKIK